MPANPQVQLTSSKIKPIDPEQATTRAVRLPAGVTYSAGQVLEELATAAQNEVQTLTYGGTPNGGSFTLLVPSTKGGGYDQIGPIAWNGTGATQAALIQAALDAYYGSGQVVVTGTGPFTLTYSGSEVSSRDIALPIAINNLTGTSPTITPATGTAGSPGPGVVFQAYSAGNARCVLESNCRTNAKGELIDEFGAPAGLTAVAFTRGTFVESDLIGLNTTAVPDSGTPGPLGRRVGGASLGAAGGLIRLGA